MVTPSRDEAGCRRRGRSCSAHDQGFPGRPPRAGHSLAAQRSPSRALAALASFGWRYAPLLTVIFHGKIRRQSGGTGQARLGLALARRARRTLTPGPGGGVNWHLAQEPGVVPVLTDDLCSAQRSHRHHPGKSICRAVGRAW